MSGLFAAGQAAPPKAANPLQDIDFMLATGLLVGTLLAGALAVSLVDRWRKKQLAGKADEPLSLSSFREMYEDGELTEEEYKRVRKKMADRIKAGAEPRPAVSPGGTHRPESPDSPGPAGPADGANSAPGTGPPAGPPQEPAGPGTFAQDF
ncbi:MAG: hypothetical protein ACRC7O_02460 [Fimbriiglobus sp.]